MIIVGFFRIRFSDFVDDFASLRMTHETLRMTWAYYMLRIFGRKNKDFLRYFYYFCKLDLINNRDIKKALKIFWLVILSITVLLLAGMLIFQLPQVQTYVATKVVDSLSEKLDGDIHFEKIHFKPFTTLVVKNVAIIDRNPVPDPADPAKAPVDTFFRAGYIIAEFSISSLFKGSSLGIERAYVSNAQMNLVLEDLIEDGQVLANENLSRIFRLKRNPEKITNPNELFNIKEVEIENFGFALINHKQIKTPRTGKIDWNDMLIQNLNVKARDLKFKGGVMTGVVDEASFREKSGFTCKSLSGQAAVGNGKTIVRNIKLKDEWSDLNLPLYMMSYANAQAFAEYITEVKMDGEIEESTLDFRTLSYFTYELDDNDLRLTVSGNASGYVNDLSFYNVRARSHAGGFSGLAEGRIVGLPQIDTTIFDGTVKNFNITTDGLSKFVSVWMKEGELDLSDLAKGYIFNVSGKVHGLLNDMKIKANLTSLIGSAKADLTLSDVISSNRPLSLDGTISTKNLDLGKILNTDILGPATVKAKAHASFEEGAPEARIDSLIVDGLVLNRYDYSGIAAAGALKENTFDLRLICNDPNLSFLFQGSFALSEKTNNSSYQFYANVGHADLNKLNIDERGMSRVQFQTNANFTHTNQGDILGKIDLGGIVLENKQGKYKIGDISLTSHTSDNKWGIRLNSKFADGSYNGTASIGKFISDLKNLTLQKEIPSLFAEPAKPWSNNNYNLHFRFHDSMDILSFALPGGYIAKNTALDLTINEKGDLNMTMTSPRVAFKRQYLKGVKVKIDNSTSALNGEVSIDEASIASVLLSDNKLHILADDNNLGVGFSYDNHGELVNRGEFVIRSLFDRVDDEVSIDINLLPTTLHLNSREWSVQPSHLTIKGSDIDVESVEFTNSEQRIHISGRTSTDKEETLSLNLDRFDISVINSLIGKDMGISGAATGNVRLTSPLKNFGLLADMICDSTYVAGVPLGVLNIGSNWDEQFDRFKINVENNLEGVNNIIAEGKLYPNTQTLEASADLNRLNIGYVQPFLEDVFSAMDGTVSGKVMLEGPLDNLNISSSDARIDDVELRVAYTNVPYYAKGTFHIDNNGAYLDNVTLRDRHDGSGIMTGKIYWDHFRDIGFDLSAKVTDMECIDLTQKQGEYFYGNLYATGNLGITGPLSAVQMNIDAITSKAGQLHIPVTYAMNSGGGTNLLRFKEPEKDVYIDPYEAMIQKMEKHEQISSDFGVKMRVTASPEVEAFVEFDTSIGDVLSGRGNGTINLEVTSDIFDITGDYNVTGGNYKFVVLGLASRDFGILDGSTIRFRGDLWDTDLDIKANYRTKASLSNLLSDTTSVANKRIVDCGIAISDKLLNPKLSFSIDIPDLDPMIKSRVESALSTEDKVQKQFLSLILSNNFLPDEQSGIVDNSSMLYSNVSEILSNQLNNIFQKLNIPLDLGLNYQPNERGNDIFDVAVSTQLFNNRVVVNGNIGNRQYSSSTTKNNVVGDIDIEIKLDRSGALRLNLFSHSADEYTNYLDNSQRNGVGLTFQTEFNSFKQLFRNMFTSKKNRQENKRLEEEAMINSEKVVIDIEKPKTNGNDKKVKRNGRTRKAILNTLTAGRQ
jgi:hypothetical protein